MVGLTTVSNNLTFSKIFPICSWLGHGSVEPSEGPRRLCSPSKALPEELVGAEPEDGQPVVLPKELAGQHFVSVPQFQQRMSLQVPHLCTWQVIIYVSIRHTSSPFPSSSPGLPSAIPLCL